MSNFTTVSAKVFKDRYDNSSSWYGSSVAQDTMHMNTVIEHRIISILHPGSLYAADKGFFGYHGQEGLRLEGMYFALPTMGFEQKTIDKGDYLAASAWFKRDYTVADLHAAGLSSTYVQFLTVSRSLFSRMLNNISWIPSSIAVKWSAAMAAGGLPIIEYTGEMVYIPSFLKDRPARQAAWNALSNQFRAITRQVNAGNMSALKNQMLALESNIDFWNTVAAYSGVELLQGKWDDLKNKIGQFNRNKALLDDNTRQMNALIAAEPDAFTAAQRQKVVQLKSQSDAISAQAKAATSGVVFKAISDEGMAINGLGFGPVVLIGLGVGVAVVVSTAGAFAIYISKQAALTSESNNTLKGFISSREAFDNARYEREQQAIIARRAQLNALKDSAAISDAEYAKQSSALAQREHIAGQNLMASRNQTASASKELNESLKQAQEDMASGFLGPMKWVAIAGAVSVVSIFVIPRVMGKK